ncbi:MAG: DUF3685 domain-containing protein [Cyanobacteria bacterium J06626_14]
MTARSQNSEIQPSIAVVLVDDDIIFRTGLRVLLNQQDDMTVIGEAERERVAINLIESAITEATSERPQVVAVVSLTLDQASGAYGGIRICQRLRRELRTIPILLVGPPIPASVISDIQQAGANGYSLKTASPDEILLVLRQMTQSQSTWMTTNGVLSVSEPNVPPQRRSRAIATPLSVLKDNIRISGIRQINAALDDLQPQLDYPGLSSLDRLVLEGRCRELRTARWMVRMLLATHSYDDRQSTPSTSSSNQGVSEGDRQQRRINQGTQSLLNSNGESDPSDWLQPTDAGGAIIGAGVEAALFDGVALKLQGSLRNLCDIPLEIDILREDKKRELLYLIVRKLKLQLDALRQSQVTPRQLIEGRSRILRDLWQRIADDFFGRYYAVQVEGLEVEVVSILLEDAASTQDAILDKIPYVSEFFAHLIFCDPLTVNSVTYGSGTPEAMIRAEELFDHILIQVANSIIQPLLNRLSDIEVIKQGFYDQNLISSRELAKFRNNLSWRYRLNATVREPIDIFESRYQLFTINGNGIRQTAIYAPRQSQLEALRGFPFLVTLALEFRDAVAPRVRAVVSFVGSGLIYVLTEVIGRGIGLIVRGVIKGIGSVLQDTRWSRDIGQR